MFTNVSEEPTDREGGLALEVKGETLPRLYDIKEQDLLDLEQMLPLLADRLTLAPMDNRIRVSLRRVQKILSDVRWNYGPPSEVGIVDDQDNVVS